MFRNLVLRIPRFHMEVTCLTFFSYYLFNSFHSFLAKRSVREDIESFDARNIPKEIRASVEELLSKNRASFDPKVIPDCIM